MKGQLKESDTNDVGGDGEEWVNITDGEVDS